MCQLIVTVQFPNLLNGTSLVKWIRSLTCLLSLWFKSCLELLIYHVRKLSTAIGMSVVLLSCPHVLEIIHEGALPQPVKLEVHYMTFKVLVGLITQQK
jgi:hypothetical protein